MANELSLREFIKLINPLLKKGTINHFTNNNTITDFYFEMNLLSKIFDNNSLINKLENCKNSANARKIKYGYYTKTCLASFYYLNGFPSDPETLNIDINSNKYQFDIHPNDFCGKHFDAKNFTINGNEAIFTKELFYDILIQFTKKRWYEISQLKEYEGEY